MTITINVSYARHAAKAAGYYVRKGAYVGTSDDVAGTYYVCRDGEPPRCYGRGYARAGDAWIAAAEAAEEDAAAATMAEG
jgi:hypothetical protein